MNKRVVNPFKIQSMSGRKGSVGAPFRPINWPKKPFTVTMVFDFNDGCVSKATINDRIRREIRARRIEVDKVATKKYANTKIKPGPGVTFYSTYVKKVGVVKPKKKTTKSKPRKKTKNESTPFVPAIFVPDVPTPEQPAPEPQPQPEPATV